MNVVDSSGWVEYFQDSPRADLFALAIEQRDQLLVPTIALFEVHKVLSRKLPAELVERCLDVMRLGRVLDVDLNRGANLVQFDDMETPRRISFRAKLEAWPEDAPSTGERQNSDYE